MGKKIENKATIFAKQICNLIMSQKLIEVKKEEIINADGRTKFGHDASKKGSYIYFLYSSNCELLYIGETGTTIKKS